MREKKKKKRRKRETQIAKIFNSNMDFLRSMDTSNEKNNTEGTDGGATLWRKHLLLRMIFGGESLLANTIFVIIGSLFVSVLACVYFGVLLSSMCLPLHAR